MAYLPWTCGQGRGCPGQQLGCRLEARTTIFLFPLMEEDEGWNSLDAQPLPNFRHRLGVELCKNCLPRGLCSGFCKFRSHHFARATPLRPEINHYGQDRLTDHSGKGFNAGDVYRQRQRRQGLLAGCAAAALAQACEGDSVNGGTVCAGDQHTTCISLEGSAHKGRCFELTDVIT